jgi:3-methyladenine DNA glycosylase AlkC
MADKFSLKDHLFNEGKVCQLARELAHVYPTFKSELFVKLVMERLPHLELKERIVHIATTLYATLPTDFVQATDIILKSLPPPLDTKKSDDDFGDFIYAPYNHYIATYGCNTKYFDHSLQMIHHLTQRFSCEDAIRVFLNTYPTETFAYLTAWSKDTNYHVRRLCSEGTRPRLPWSAKIRLAIETPLLLLENLHADKTRYVTRSVANHLNDISKSDPDLVVDTLIRWKNSQRQNPKEMDFITRHALRTLVKVGHPKALKILGYQSESPVQVTDFTVPKKVTMDTALVFSCTLKCAIDTPVLVDYVIYFRNNRGILKSGKVYKLTQLTLQKNIPLTITKSHPLRSNMTTRPLYEGVHKLELQINGKIRKGVEFMLQKNH